jgi:hypothetical protein
MRLKRLSLPTACSMRALASLTRRHHRVGDRSRTSTGHARHRPVYEPSVRSGPPRLAKIGERGTGRDGPSKPRDRYVPRRPTEQRTDSRDWMILRDAASSGQAGGGSISKGANCSWATPCGETLTQGADVFFDLDQTLLRRGRGGCRTNSGAIFAEYPCHAAELAPRPSLAPNVIDAAGAADVAHGCRVVVDMDQGRRANTGYGDRRENGASP